MPDGIQGLIATLSKNDKLQHLSYDYLVDVFLVWDCYRQDWIDDSPLLLRFETDDVLITPNQYGDQIFILGPVDTTQAPRNLSHAGQSVDTGSEATALHDALSATPPQADLSPSDECLCWLSIRHGVSHPPTAREARQRKNRLCEPWFAGKTLSEIVEDHPIAADEVIQAQ